MKTSHALLPVIILALSVFSCKDQGEIPEYVEVTSLRPAPNEVNVDKGTYIRIGLNRAVHVSQAGKIQLRYVNDTSAINNFTYCGYTPPEVNLLCAGPFIWKPGRIVEVTIPKDISDPEGRMMKEDFVYLFSIARDTIAFRLVSSLPLQNDSVTAPIIFGILTFSDYLYMPDSVLTINPPAQLRILRVIVEDGRNGPSSVVGFSASNLEPRRTYEITVPRQIKDYEGETLPQDYWLVFHTRP